MTTCELIPQAVQQFGGIITRADSLAIVPDIHNYSFVGTTSSSDLQPRKRERVSASDCLELDLENFTFPEPPPESKRQCRDYSVSPSPNQFQSVSSPESIEEFALEVKGDFKFENTGIFTFGGNSPPSSSPSLTSFTPTNSQTSAAAAQQDFDLQTLVSSDLFDNMHRPQTALNHPLTQQHADKYELIITEQPEEYYRARYNSEGVRAPLKGMTENYPTVQVYGPEFRYGRIDVKLVHEDGSPHTSCSLDTSEGRKNAVSKKIGPFNHMIAEFEDLRIRRVKKEGRKKSSTIEKTAPKDGRSDKVASLLFTATLETEQGEIVQSIQSKPISLTTAPEPAELDWLEPNRGHFAGQEPVVIKGSKMTSPKVTFRIVLPNGRRQELHGAVDKERSHQNVLLVKTPSLTQLSYQFPHQTIRAEVVVVTGRNQMSSNALQFDFIPNHICRECMQDTQAARPPLIQMNYPTPIPPPSYPTPSAATPTPSAAASSNHSPPTTPGGLPPQPSPSPSTQIQTPTSAAQQVHFAPAQSQAQPTYSTHSADALASQQNTSTHQGKSGDDIITIMQDLMGQEGGVAMKTIEPTAYWQMEGHQMVQVGSPYIPVTSPSANSDHQPCYSPVTPVQSPPEPSSWTYIEQMLNSLRHSEQLTSHDYRILAEECAKRNPHILQAFNNSQNNENVFLQLLAYPKPEPSAAAYQTTPQ